MMNEFVWTLNYDQTENLGYVASLIKGAITIMIN
jgi:hypothetical protein